MRDGVLEDVDIDMSDPFYPIKTADRHLFDKGVERYVLGDDIVVGHLVFLVIASTG